MTPRRNHDPADFIPHGAVLAATLVVIFLLCLLAAKAAAFGFQIFQ
jgi:hypothetical protein